MDGREDSTIKHNVEYGSKPHDDVNSRHFAFLLVISTCPYATTNVKAMPKIALFFNHNVYKIFQGH